MTAPQPAAVVNVQPPTGNYVTREVFDATVTPITQDIGEIKADVKTLLARDAGRSAVAGLVSRTITITTTVVAGGMGALVALLFHH